MPFKDLEKRRAAAREATKRYRTKYPEAKKKYSLMKNYGITLDQWDKMFEDQKGSCAICSIKRDEDKNPFHVDHCHTTGKVRGLLCHKCNRAIGFFSDSPALLRKAADYLDG